jgi:organic radical activating enzyme
MLEFTQVEIAIEFTEFCNLRCHYCCQNYEHKDTSVIPFKNFKIFMDLFFKKLSQNKNKIHLDISLLGGELSVLYKENEYFKYFEYLVKLIDKYKIDSTFILLSNFTGDIEFFQDFINLETKYVKTELHITFHETYFTTSKKINKAFDKLWNLKFKKDFKLDIAFLENESKNFKTMKKLFDDEYSKRGLPKNIKIISDKLLKTGLNKNGEFGLEVSKRDEDSVNNIKYCNVLQFEFDIPNLLIIDECRDIKKSILSWKLPENFVKCDRNCPYPSLWENFLQLSPEEYKKIKNEL